MSELENATPVGSEWQGAWTRQDWEDHLAKLEKHKVRFQQAVCQVSAPGNATPLGSEQRGEWTRQDWEVNLVKLAKHVKEGRAPMHLLTISQDMYVYALQSLEIRDASQDRSPNHEMLESGVSAPIGLKSESSSAYQETKN